MSLPVSLSYTEYNPNTGITANGVFAIAAPFAGSDYALYVAGSFGDGTITFGYIDSVGAFTSFKDASNAPVTTTSSNGVIVPAPPSKILAVSLSSSTAPSIQFSHVLRNR